MIRTHLSADELMLLAGHERPPKEFWRALQHMSFCVRCRAMLSALPTAQRDVLEVYLDNRIERCSDRVREHAYSEAIDRAFQSVLAENARLEDDRARAPDLVGDLKGLPFNQAQLLVQNSSQYQTWGLVEQLLQCSKAGWREDPAKSEELALLAVAVAERINASEFRAKILNDLKAESWSFVANCRRIRADFRSAEAGFQQAEAYLQKGTGDPMERAQLSNLRFSLASAQRDFSRAAHFLEEATKIYRSAGDHHLEGRCLIQKAKLYHNSGRVEEAVPILERAAVLINSRREPWLEFIVRQNLVAYLVEVGRSDEARLLLPEVRELAHKYGNRFDRLRLLWTEGLLCKSLGRTELAEEALRQVREGFMAAEIGNDVALVSLDLAALYLENNRTAEVKQLAAEMLPIFHSLGIHREAIMAWSVFRQAVEREVATVRMVKEVAARIREIQRGPASAGAE